MQKVRRVLYGHSIDIYFARQSSVFASLVHNKLPRKTIRITTTFFTTSNR